jgi:hypothetical protein
MKKQKRIFTEFVQNGYREREIGIPRTGPQLNIVVYGISLHHYIKRII